MKLRILSGKKVLRRRNNDQPTVSKTKPSANSKIKKSMTITKKPISKSGPRTKIPSSTKNKT